MIQDVKPRLDRDARREAILDVASDVFQEEGYANASMSTIAARVGGSKGTLYNYFKNKEELFAAYVVRHCAWQRDAMFEIESELGDIREALIKTGRIYLSIVLSDFSMANFRVIVAEAQRTPEIGLAFYEAGPKSGSKRLGATLQKAVESGQLKIDDPVHAAQQFIGLCQNRLLKARLCNVMAEPTPEEIDREVLPAVNMFLAAYGTGR
ncbi:TetR family transcriptional regulator [Caulobacter sp. Root1455]|uniref:TetR/AcrR family transcriptional regulator n=1 Tax=unclassified Caulobacter TaxID=2648921 RepID=UPI0006FD085D|nr:MULTISPECIES: TetR/AcrR family transcriptional regulator [unclassified Caulobacter]KQY30249.1 TetR family transcriptional regulator [Caulobacter sp. Root487D2Y]KQY92547.1 TetR family transcriptional regulator [Caulobacter sp. Root1455]